MKSVCFALTVFLMFGIIYCKEEPCVEADGCFEDVVDPRWVTEMNEALIKKSLEIRVKEILKIIRKVKAGGNEVSTKAEIVVEDGRTCTATWIETMQHADDWIPDMGIDCGSGPETEPEIKSEKATPEVSN